MCVFAIFLQDIGSMEEKIEYRLEERTSDIQDLLENCQTRVKIFNVYQPITRQQKFRQVQIETNCRRHFKVHLKWKISAI